MDNLETELQRGELSDANRMWLAQCGLTPGQQYDEETGLYYNRHRYYDPLQGRYITQDPIGLRGGLNFYIYAHLNSVSNIDPLGLDPFFSGMNMDGVKQRASLGMHLVENGYSPTQIENIMNPKSESLFSPFETASDFYQNYTDMREANTIGVDKYFHCKANCEATRRGSVASWIACKISNVREIVDQRIKGDLRSASVDDQKANHHGRNQANSSGSCAQVCAVSRPNGLDSKY